MGSDMSIWQRANLLLLLAGIMPTTADAMQTSATYHLSWSEASFPTARLEVNLPIVEGRLQMFPGLTSAFNDERGWAANIRNLAVTDSAGALLEVEPLAGPEWRVGDGYEGEAKISYEVDFGFAKRRFDTGNEQIAWLEEKALFTTGFALFLYSSMETPAGVQISAPPDWQLATSWLPSDDGGYAIPNTNHLIRNVLTVGKDYGLETLAHDAFTVHIALLGHHAGASDLVRATFTEILDTFVDIMDFSSPGHFTMVLLPGPNDGEGYMTSFASSQPSVPDRENILVWANSLAHELFHYWNGSRISSLQEHYVERQWFSEGFTEYFANVALRETSLITPRRYDEILGHYLSFHLFFSSSGLFEHVTMRQAGQKKGLYRPAVYDSGVAVAFCLDGLIREYTGGDKSLNDMMKLMENRYGKTGRPIVFADIAEAASETAGSDLSDFFSTHVEARQPLPVSECAGRMGYRALVDGYHVYLERVQSSSRK